MEVFYHSNVAQDSKGRPLHCVDRSTERARKVCATRSILCEVRRPSDGSWYEAHLKIKFQTQEERNSDVVVQRDHNALSSTVSS